MRDRRLLLGSNQETPTSSWKRNGNAPVSGTPGEPEGFSSTFNSVVHVESPILRTGFAILGIRAIQASRNKVYRYPCHLSPGRHMMCSIGQERPFHPVGGPRRPGSGPPPLIGPRMQYCTAVRHESALESSTRGLLGSSPDEAASLTRQARLPCQQPGFACRRLGSCSVVLAGAASDCLRVREAASMLPNTNGAVHRAPCIVKKYSGTAYSMGIFIPHGSCSSAATASTTSRAAVQ